MDTCYQLKNVVKMDSAPLVNGTKDEPLIRPCNQPAFNQHCEYAIKKPPGLISNLRRSSNLTIWSCFTYVFPVLNWLPKYNVKEDFVSDVISGFTVAVMHIPQGMAYSSLAGVPPIVGLYMAFFPVLAYFFLGSSRHVSMGTFAIVCMMAGKPVMKYSTSPDHPVATDTDLSEQSYTPLEVATIVCLVVGIWQVVLGIFRLGSLSVLMSDTLVSGFTTGAAVLVFCSQIKHVFGIKLPRRSGHLKLIYTCMDLFENIDKTNPLAVVMTFSVIAMLITYFQFIKPKLHPFLRNVVPMELIVIMIGTFVSYYFNLQDTYNLSTIGLIPTGLPTPAMPPVRLILDVGIDGLVIAIVAFSINISMATLFAKKEHYKVDANQELIASCVLAGIILFALKGMLKQVKDFPPAWRRSRRDGAIWLITFFAVILIDVDVGLVLGIIVSLVVIIMMSQSPYVNKLGKLPNTDLFLESDRYNKVIPIPNTLIIRICGGLHFANKSNVRRKIDKVLKKSIAATAPESPITKLVIDMSSVTFIDPASTMAFLALKTDLQLKNITLILASCSSHVYEQLRRAEFFLQYPEETMFPTVSDAVSS
ncbi:solute carrier family 26 member 9-like isoform X4 [Macrosteles quadrilineatus]|uniref:solute carrier family 26 member 9-like isoform X4 n=1 Tax=Macrosteles quadrilineatus TaxID=74068 RepID=UPI0023E34E63|nr:solute carrier family 26 member 9-like isoform X4 [Macrosteles quadrilineatus]